MAYYYEITVKARLTEEILDIAEMLNLEVDNEATLENAPYSFLIDMRNSLKSELIGKDVSYRSTRKGLTWELQRLFKSLCNSRPQRPERFQFWLQSTVCCLFPGPPSTKLVS